LPAQDALIRKFQEEIKQLQSELAEAKSTQQDRGPGDDPSVQAPTDGVVEDEGKRQSALEAAILEQVWCKSCQILCLGKAHHNAWLKESKMHACSAVAPGLGTGLCLARDVSHVPKMGRNQKKFI
jgi:hypothetical protein